MGRVPRQTSVIRGLRDQAQSLRNSELVLADKLSARVAQAEKAIKDAEAAAVAAQLSANAANEAAGRAETAANTANTNAGIALNAADNITNNIIPNQINPAINAAQGAANAANAAVAVLQFTDVFTSNPTTSGPNAPLIDGQSMAVVPQMSQTGDYGGYPLIAFFSAGLYNEENNSAYYVDFGIYDNGVLLPASYRRVDLTAGSDGGTVSILHAWRPPAGSRTIQVRWSCEGGPITSPLLRRQFSVFRIGTP